MVDRPGFLRDRVICPGFQISADISVITDFARYRYREVLFAAFYKRKGGAGGGRGRDIHLKLSGLPYLKVRLSVHSGVQLFSALQEHGLYKCI